MSPNPDAFLSHLRARGYHSRSDRHSNALAIAIAEDLARRCPLIERRAAAGEVVFDLNFDLFAGTAEWNVDLVLGTPAAPTPPAAGQAVARTTPATVQIAVELKSIMTEHGKAMKNRKRDLEAHHEHVHNYSNRAIAAGVFVINASARFQSPLRRTPSEHRNPARLAERCIDELRAVNSRSDVSRYGLDAKCAIVVDMDNVDLATTRYVEKAPAPRMGDPLHYDGFIQSICALYTDRFQ